MAGDWMKIELELPDKPEVHAIAAMLCIDPDCVVGKLIRVWQWFDKHTTDGNAYGVTYLLPDRISGVIGFGEAMSFVGWLEQRDKTLHMPKFDRHTSESAKARALTAKRVANHKAKSNAKGNGDSVTSTVSEALPREEKRREEETITQDKPARKKTTPHPLPDDFAPNETSISLAKSLGISWQAEIPKFRDHHSQKGTVGRDWQAGFRTWLNNAVKFGTATKATIGDSSVGLPSDIIKLPDGRVMTRAGLDLIRSFG